MTMCTIYLLGRNILAFGITSLRLPFVHSFQEKGKVIHYRVSTESEVRWGVSAPERLSWLRVPAWPRGMAPGHPPCSPTPSARMLALFHAPPPQVFLGLIPKHPAVRRFFSSAHRGSSPFLDGLAYLQLLALLANFLLFFITKWKYIK